MTAPGASTGAARPTAQEPVCARLPLFATLSVCAPAFPPPQVGPCSQVENMQSGKENSGAGGMRLVESVVS